jgi:hypothetical protein
MSDQAPICLIQPVISTEQPPPVNFPAIPPAVDLQSALNAINALRHSMYILTGQLNHAFQGTQGPPGKAGQAGKAAPKGGKYVEQQAKRVTNTVKLASKEDPSTFITFKRIDGLTFVDNKTGELWSWQRGNSDGTTGQ